MYVLKTTGFSANIVYSVSSLDVLIIGTAIQHNMAFRGCISRVGVVIRRISIENIGGVMNFYLPAKMKDRTIFFLSIARMVTSSLLIAEGADGGAGDAFDSEEESNWLVTEQGATSR